MLFRSDWTAESGDRATVDGLLRRIGPPAGTLDDVVRQGWGGLTVETLLNGSRRTFVNRSVRDAVKIILEQRLVGEPRYAGRFGAQRLVLITDGREEEAGEGNRVFHREAYESVLAELAAYRDRLKRLEPPVEFDYREIVYDPAMAAERSAMLVRHGFQPASVTGFERAASAQPETKLLHGSVSAADLRGNAPVRIALQPPLKLDVRATDNKATPGRLGLSLAGGIAATSPGVLELDPAQLEYSGTAGEVALTMVVRSPDALVRETRDGASPEAAVALVFAPSDTRTLADPLAADRVPVVLHVRRPAVIRSTPAEVAADISPAALSKGAVTRVSLEPVDFVVSGAGSTPVDGVLSFSVATLGNRQETAADLKVEPETVTVEGGRARGVLKVVVAGLCEPGVVLPKRLGAGLQVQFTPAESELDCDAAQPLLLPLYLDVARRVTVESPTRDLNGEVWAAALRAGGQERIVLRPPLQIRATGDDGANVSGTVALALSSPDEGSLADAVLESAMNAPAIRDGMVEGVVWVALRDPAALLKAAGTSSSLHLDLTARFAPDDGISRPDPSVLPPIPVGIHVRNDDAPVALRGLVRGVRAPASPEGLTVVSGTGAQPTGFHLDLPPGAESFAKLNWEVNTRPSSIQLHHIAPDGREEPVPVGTALSASGNYRVSPAGGLREGVVDTVLELSPANEHVVLDLGGKTDAKALINVRVRVLGDTDQ